MGVGALYMFRDSLASPNRFEPLACMDTLFHGAPPPSSPVGDGASGSRRASPPRVSRITAVTIEIEIEIVQIVREVVIQSDRVGPPGQQY